MNLLASPAMRFKLRSLHAIVAIFGDGAQGSDVSGDCKNCYEACVVTEFLDELRAL